MESPSGAAVFAPSTRRDRTGSFCLRPEAAVLKTAIWSLDTILSSSQGDFTQPSEFIGLHLPTMKWSPCGTPSYDTSRQEEASTFKTDSQQVIWVSSVYFQFFFGRNHKGDLNSFLCPQNPAGTSSSKTYPFHGDGQHGGRVASASAAMYPTHFSRGFSTCAEKW